jgi:hypothetical protein
MITILICIVKERFIIIFRFSYFSFRIEAYAPLVCIPLEGDTVTELRRVFLTIRTRLERKTAAFFEQGNVNVVRQMA